MLERLLKCYYRSARRRSKAKISRVLPFGDHVSKRLGKVKDLHMGVGSSFYDCALALDLPKVGKNIWIGPHSVIDSTGGLEIGDHCNISAGVQIYSHDSIARCLSGGTEPITHAPVTIGERTYISPNCVITKGVKIGSGCVIDANSLVLEDIEDGWMAMGTPCKPFRPIAASDLK